MRQVSSALPYEGLLCGLVDPGCGGQPWRRRLVEAARYVSAARSHRSSSICLVLDPPRSVLVHIERLLWDLLTRVGWWYRSGALSLHGPGQMSYGRAYGDGREAVHARIWGVARRSGQWPVAVVMGRGEAARQCELLAGVHLA